MKFTYGLRQRSNVNTRPLSRICSLLYNPRTRRSCRLVWTCCKTICGPSPGMGLVTPPPCIFLSYVTTIIGESCGKIYTVVYKSKIAMVWIRLISHNCNSFTWWKTGSMVYDSSNFNLSFHSYRKCLTCNLWLWASSSAFIYSEKFHS